MYNYISAYVNVCVNYMCVWAGERVGYVLFVTLWQKHGQDLSILSFCLLYLFVWPVSLWVLVIFPLKKTEIIWRSDTET